MKYFILITVNVCSTLILNAQTIFQTTLGKPNEDRAYSALILNDGYIIAQNSNGFGGGANVGLLRLNSSGEELWYRNYSGFNSDYPSKIILNPDSGFTIVGQTYSYGQGGYDACIARTTSNGEVLWSKSTGTIFYDSFYDAQSTPDGGYIACGNRGEFGECFVARFDSEGELLWSKGYGVSGYLTSIENTPGGGFITINTTPGIAGFQILKLSDDGTTEWAKRYLHDTDDSSDAFQILPVSNGAMGQDGYVICGQTYHNAFGGVADIFLMKISIDGTFNWFKRYGSTYMEAAESMVLTSDGGFALAGWTNSTGFGDMDGMLLKTDNAGNVNWAYSYGFGWQDTFQDVVNANDNGFLMIGKSYAQSQMADSINVLITRTNFLGETSCQFQSWDINTADEEYTPSSLEVVETEYNVIQDFDWASSFEDIQQLNLCSEILVEESIVQSSIVLYPNPAADQIFIKSPDTRMKYYQVFDIYGKLQSQGSISSSSQFQLDIRSLPQGLFQISVLLDNGALINRTIIHD